VSNACEALEGGPGTVTVRTAALRVGREDLEGALGASDAREGPHVLLEVSDDGPGIDAADHARIFEPFFTTKPSGRGLGLASVLGIVQGHRGVIRVSSARGRGTTFRVLLPLADPDSLPASRPRVPAPARPGATILVVDDEEPVREVTAAFLGQAGFRVLEAEGGEQALELLRTRAGEIDLVVLDLSMPGLGGRATLARVRQARPDVPVVVVSGYEVRRASEACGAEEATFLRKPFEPEDLVACVRAALDRG
jgi:CheY-like chemotaxis protein